MCIYIRIPIVHLTNRSRPIMFTLYLLRTRSIIHTLNSSLTHQPSAHPDPFRCLSLSLSIFCVQLIRVRYMYDAGVQCADPSVFGSGAGASDRSRARVPTQSM